MFSQRRLAIGGDDPVVRSVLLEGLGRLGCRLVADAAHGDELIEACQRCAPELVICDASLRAGERGSAAAYLALHEHLPVIIVTYDNESLVAQLAQGPFVGYLLKPLRQEELAPTIALAFHRHEENSSLRAELEESRRQLSDRKIIEQAKGMLMRRAGLDESQAFHRLQQAARQHRQKMVDVARGILLAEGIVAADATADDE